MKPLVLLKDVINRRYERFTGRGSTALWLALEAMAIRDGRRGEIILPDLVCTSVLETIVAAGFKPRLADVDPTTYCLTPETIKLLLSPSTSAIIVVHLFGQVAQIEKIADLASEHCVWLIEDAVQGVGGYSESGTPVGGYGDFTFVSFAPTKTIRGQGGALLYDDDLWDDLVRSVLTTHFPIENSPSDQLLQTSLRDLYHALGQAVRQDKLSKHQAARTFRDSLVIYRHLLFRSFNNHSDNLNVIQCDLRDLPRRIARRNEMALVLYEALKEFPVLFPRLNGNDAIWRYTVRFPDRETADYFIVALRRQGGLVSHLYYPLHQLYEPELSLSTQLLAPRLVNLWVDEVVEKSYVKLVKNTAYSTFSLCRQTMPREL